MGLEVHRGLFAVGLEPLDDHLLDVHGSRRGAKGDDCDAPASALFSALARVARLEERPCLATAKSDSFVEARGESRFGERSVEAHGAARARSAWARAESWLCRF
jgi:hypothetical protein